MSLQGCSSSDLRHPLWRNRIPFFFTSPPPPAITSKSSFSMVSGLERLKLHAISASSSSSSRQSPSTSINNTGKKKKRTPPLHSIIASLETKDLQIESDFAQLLTELSPKELTVILKQQRDWRHTLRLFNWMRSQESYNPNPIHYNVVLRTLGRAREWDELRLCWIHMARDGVFPTNNTYATLIDVYDKAGLRKEALLWLKHMRVRGISPDEVTMNTVVRILKDSGQFDQAEKFFKGWCSGTVELDILDTGGSDNNDDITGLLSPKHFLLTELFKSGRRPPPIEETASAPVLDEGLRKPRLAATYNTLIDMYGKAGRLKEASDAFAEMLRTGVAPDTTTFNTMIHICGTHGNLDEAEALLAKMEDRRIPPDTKTFNIFMTLYSLAGNTERVLMYYSKIRDCGLKPDAVTQRIVLQVLCERKMVNEVENVIRETGRLNMLVDEQSVPVVLKMYIDGRLLDRGKLFLEKHCFTRGISSSNYAAIIDAYAEKGLWMEAEDIFYRKRSSGHKKDVVEYNVMIKAYGKSKQYDKAIALFENMASCGTWPDECTYNSLIQMLSGGDLPDKARILLAKMQVAGFRPRCETFSAVIASSTRAGLVSGVVEVYNEMMRLGVEPNEIVYGSLINAFAEAGKAEEALSCFRKMEESGLPINQIVITSLIKAYSKVGCWQKAQKLYAKMKDLKDGPDIIASNSMIDLYADLGMVSEAELIFNELRQNGRADGISYATMMHLYKSMGMLDEAIEVAQEMKQSGLLTDCLFFNNVMASYAANGQLRECAELLHQMQVQRILPDTATFKVIFTVLKKGGIPFEAVDQLESSYIDGKPYARQAIITSLFSVVGMHEVALESCETFVTAEVTLDSSAYNAAIYAYGTSGKVDRALNLLMRMQDEGIEPDVVTYINLAGCYGKAGLVEGVKRIYSKLKYGEIEPNESLFRSVINAYRDAGKPDLADLVDQEMRFSLQMKEEIDTDSGTGLR